MSDLPRRRSTFALTALTAALLSALPLAAQAAAPTTGSVLKQTAPPPALPQPPGAVIAIPAPHSPALNSSVRLTVRTLRITGNTLLPAATLEHLAARVQGKTVTLKQLQQLAEQITALYHAHGHPLAYAYLPAQTVRHGVIEIAVIEPRYDRIDIQNHSHLKTEVARDTLGVHAGQYIAQRPLSRGLLLLSRTPGVRVAGTLVPGARPATSTLDVHLADEPRVRASLGADNYGNTYTGRGRATANIAVSDPFGYGSQFAVNGLTTESGLLHAGGFALLSPNLWNGLRLNLYGSRTVYRLGGPFADLGQSGQANQFGLSARYPLILQPGRLLQLNFDVQRTNTTQNTASTGQQRRSHIDRGSFGFSGALADQWGGVTYGGASVAYGQLVPGNAAAVAADTAAGTIGHFWVGQFNLGRRQPLPAQWQLTANLSGQIASRNLDGSQQFYLGGPNGVMSYPVGEAGGADGVLLRVRLGHALPLPARVPGQLRGTLLAQAGRVIVDRFPAPGTHNRLDRAGVGVGLTYAWNTRLNARLSYVHQVGPAQATAGPDHQGEIWAGLNVNF
ncbi:ShlB/FhaC/HecB family hemolysin secretion/activation protein [Acidihalobacter ferrooxydans]|uniref:POTRA domain-containing protein n=1 Tax=Acidihalobacter ferrooxydans TaxID=1765967 RepID=A0A1P8UF58_9GAMM|nr:POTRA domain-containing protein [Acidihalobacter ferrooxydans]APZ42465.1 hypothetical protein BW247_04650 [Acidihalobacter ferrooxydans]